MRIGVWPSSTAPVLENQKLRVAPEPNQPMLARVFLQLHNQHMNPLLPFAESAASLQRKLIFGLRCGSRFVSPSAPTLSQVSNIISAFLW
jgi:hypothetical protein